MRNWRSLLFFLVAIVTGAAGATCFAASERGIISGQWFPLVLAAILALFILGLFLRGRPEARAGRSFLALVVIVFSWAMFGSALPDPAVVYFHIFQKEIESHWKNDPVTKVVYFPIDYTIDDGGKNFPRNFYVLNNAGTFAVDKYDNRRLTSPKCDGSKYTAKSIRENVLFLRFYIDDPDEPVRSCLITPISDAR